MEITDELGLDNLPEATKTMIKLNMVKHVLGDSWQIPVMIANGSKGPCLGITAALHGNELNGISTIHSLWDHIDPKSLRGTLILVPILNTAGFLNGEREFSDGKDLNRVMPGSPNGTPSEVYAHTIITKVVSKFQYLIDLHTASFGRINSLYVKADLSLPAIKTLALEQNPQIIVDKKGPDGSLREEAARLGIPSITVEIGNPYLFQKNYIKPSIDGLMNTLIELGMIDAEKKAAGKKPVLCNDSHWVYASTAGILKVYPALAKRVKRGEVVASITNVFGQEEVVVRSPANAIVIGKSTNPVCDVGARIIHLGLMVPR